MDAMTERTVSILTLATVLGGSLLLGGAALAQSGPDALLAELERAPQSPPQTDAQIRARAATSALNGGPAETTLTPRLNAQPPLSDAERPTPVRPLVTMTPRPEAEAPVVRQVQAKPLPRSQVRPPVTAPDEDIDSDAETTAQAQTPARPGPPSITLAPGQSEPDPISMPLGYYVRGDKGCNEVWPGEGNLAWFTPTAFTIDFGGCEPGEFMQTGPNSWTEEQQCMTELGGDAGLYKVTYEAVEAGVLLRRAEMDIDGSVEEDQWRHCEIEDVPQEARFKS
jgi:hypothetical protein